jgi:hypothetical protein
MTGRIVQTGASARREIEFRAEMVRLAAQLTEPLPSPVVLCGHARTEAYIWAGSNFRRCLDCPAAVSSVDRPSPELDPWILRGAS